MEIDPSDLNWRDYRLVWRVALFGRDRFGAQMDLFALHVLASAAFATGVIIGSYL